LSNKINIKHEATTRYQFEILLLKLKEPHTSRSLPTIGAE